MKFIRPFVLITFCFTSQFILKAQNNNGSIDAVGDIAFVAFHDDDDGFAFVLLDDCTAGQVIRFIDEGWTGSAFASASSEGEVTWTNSTGSTIDKGTVITITDADDNSAGISASQGTAVEAESGFTTGVSAEQIYAVTGTRAAPGTFLSAIGNLALDGTTAVTLTGTGLTNGTNALDLGDGEAYYNGTRAFSGTLSAAAAAINTLGSWNITAFSYPGTGTGAFSGSTFGGDTDAPVVSSITVSGSPSANATSMSYVVDFDENANNVSTDDFTVSTASGTATGTVTAVSASSGDPITVTVSSITGTGSIRLDLKASTNIQDDAANSGPAAFTSGSTHTVDRDAPSVNSITLSGSPAATATSVTYVVAFSESVANVSTDDFELTKGSTANGSIASVSAATGTSINVVVNSITGTGTLRLDLNGSTNIADAAGNTPPAAFTSGSSHTVDRDAPSVTSITLSGSPTATATSVTYVVAFNESVANVSTDDFALTKGSTANGAIASVSASTGTSINVVVNSITGTGTLRLDLNGSTNIADAAGNTPPAAFTSGSSHTVDRDAPSVTSITLSGSPTATATSVTYVVAFNESVANVSTDDFALTKGSTANGAIASVSASTGTSINVVVNSITGTGTLRLDLNGSTNIADAAGNTPPAAFTSGSSHTVDRDAPSVTSITLSGSPTATATSVTYVVAFSESVANVSTDDFALTKGSTANGTIASVSASTGTSINVVVNSITGTGTLRLDLNGSTNIADASGNTPPAAFTSGSSHTVDRDAPSVTSITLSGSPTATATSVTYVVAFNESVANVSTDDFALTKGSTANGTIASVSASTGTSINVVVNSITGTGTLRLDLNGSTNIADASGNTPPAAFTSGSSHTVDRDAPSVTSITLSGSPTATATSVTYVVAFNESVANVSTDDFALTKGSTANGAIASVSASTGTSINVVVNSITGTGTLRLDLNGSTNIADAAGNTPPAAFTSGSSHTVDRDAPSVTSITLSGSPTATATSVTYVVAFSESVANVSTDDFALTKGSTANGTIASVSASTGTSINVVVNSITGTGTLRLDLNGSTNIADAAGNTPPAAFTSGSSHTVDRDAPTLSSSNPVDNATSVSASGNITLTFSENIAFGTGNIQVIDVTDGSNSFTIDAASPGAQASISNTVLTINPSSDLDENANYAIQIAGTAIDDLSGNSYAGILNNTTLDFTTADVTAPTVQSSSPTDDATNVTLSQNLTITFDDNIVVGIGNITIVETGVGNFEQLDVTNGALVSVSTTTVTLNPTGTMKKGTAYHILIDATALVDDAANSFAGIADATTLNFTTVDVVINEVVTDPQQDWSTNGFNGTAGAGTVSDGVDEFVELLINSAGIDFAGWTIELNDGSNVTGDLSNTGAFDATTYSGTGTFNNTAAGDYLVLGNVDGAGAMNNTGLTINLKDPGGAIVDAIVIGGGVGEAPTGDATSVADESVQRFTNGLDTDTNNSDFTKGPVTMGAANSGPSVTLTQSAVTLVEAAGTNTITATLSATSSQNTTVTIGVKAGGTATITNDFTLSTTSIVITAGNTTGTATLTAVQDALDEDNETVTIEITGVTNGSENGTQEVASSITDDDAEPSVTLTQSTTTFAEAAGTNTVTATLSAASGKDVTVTIGVKAGGTATITNDFTLSTTSIVITAGNTTGTATLTAVQDVIDEDNETVTIEITGVTNGSENGTQEVASTITDDDAEPSVTLTQSTTTFAEAAVTNTVTATLSAASGKDVTVTIGVKAGGTATITNDFTLSTTSIVITAGNTTGTATLTAVQDVIDEDNETVTIEITGVTNGTENGTQEVASTITDDDAEPSVTLTQSTTTFAEAAGTNTVTATLSAASGKDVTVTIGVKAGGTATITNDFTLSTTSIVITAGNTTGTATLTAVQDVIDEDNETVTIEITGVTNGSENGTQEVASTITDDDAEPSVTLTQSTTTFAEAAVTNTVTATLSAASGKDVTVTIGVKAGGTATITNDFTLSTTSIVITAGNTTGTATLTAVQDVIDEDNETVTIEITGVTNGTENGTQEVASTITDDDAEPSVTLTQSTTTFAEAAGTNTVTATLSAASGKDVTVTIGVKAGGTATITNDFTLSTTSIVITAGNTTGTATLTAVQDVIDEDNETVTIEITGVTNGSENGTQEVASTITDDDAEPSVTLTQSTTTFAEAAVTNTVTATLSAASGKDVTVTIGVKAGGTATITNDFTLSTTSIVITAGNTTGTATLTAVQDVIDEDNETVTIEITGVTNGTENGTQEVASSITDDDAEPTVTLSVGTANVVEAAGTSTITATLSAMSGKDVTVTLGYTGTATNGTDYNNTASTSITINAGSLSANAAVGITATQDANPETNETIIIDITGVTNGTEDGTQQQTITITDDDTPNVSFTATSSSGVESVTSTNIPVNLSIASGLTVTVDYAVTGTATGSGTDYTLADGTLTFTPASTTQNITIAGIANDLLDEFDETVILTLSSPSNANLGTNTVHTYTITDDDAEPSVTLTQSTTTFAEAAGTNTVTATLSAASGKDVTVTIGVKSGGTATITNDFTLSTTSIVITAGNTTGTATLTAVQDALDEDNETVTIEITGVTNGTENGTQEVASTITDDDAEPSVTLTQSTTTFAEAAGTNTVTATLSAASGKDVTVTIGVKAGGTATITNDFTLSTTSIVITAGNTTGTATLTAVQDVIDEDNETVTVEITGVTNGSENGTQEVASTITDDDAEPSVTLTQSTTTFAEAAGTNTVTATLSAASGKDVTVTIGVKSGGTATITNDFTLSTTSIVITAGNTTGTATLTAVQDVIDEDNETVTVEITGVTNGSENGTQEVVSTITDDDAEPTVAFGLTADGQSESEASQDIQVSLSAKSGKTITVDYAVTGTATAGGIDHTTAAGTITFNPGDQDFQQQIVGIVDDALDEENETIILTLSNPVNASLGTNTQLTYTITDNDAAPTVTLSVGTNSIAEAAGTSTVTATLSAVSGKDVTVTLGYTGTATNGTDYNNTASTSIVITAGNLSANAAVGITATQDVNPETNETIILDITGITNGTESGTQQQTITIIDDDTPSVSFTSSSSSGAESVTSANLTVDLSIASGLSVTVDYAVTGTATGSGTDYTLANGTLTFIPTDVQETISIAGIVDDSILESNETVIVTLSNPSNANLGVNTVHTYTINNNDAAAVTIADVSGNENDGVITVTATLDNAVQGGFTVDVNTADGVATTADSDYTAFAGQTLTFAGTAGETQTFTIAPTADTKLEANETLTISQNNLSATSLGVVITDGASVTITNDDVAAVTIADVSGNEDSGAITVTATLDNAVQGGFTVDVSTADGTATIAGSDYTAVTGQTLTFAGTAGETQTFIVTPTTDSNAEVNETIIISQSNLAATTLAVNITDGATVTINDDDDGTAPTGYSVTFDDALIGGSEVTTSKFTFAGAEVGATYNYTVSSSGGGTAVTGTGTISTATDQITLASLSGLTDGTLTLSVTLTDPSSNVGTAVTGTTIIDQTAPSAPSVTTVTSDSGTNGADGITNDNTPDANGTAEANASVEIFVDGVSAGTTTADGSGNWTLAYNGSSPVSDGTIVITAKATDAAGNTSAASSGLTVLIDTVAPAAPVVSSITTDSGANGADQVTNDNTLSFNGTAEANASVELFINATSIGSTSADVSGNFSFDHSATTLVDAAYSITAKATDTAGNTSAESSALAVTVDTAAPAAPVVGLATSSDLGISTTDGLTSDNTPTLEGTAEANASVELLVDNVSIGTTTADGSGAWTLTAGSAVADGVKSIIAKATDLSGNTSANSSALSITIDTSISNPTLSPVDNATGILPNANLTLTFVEDINKGTGNITIKKSSDNSTLETIDVTASTVTISGGVVTIDPVGNILPPATEFYVNVDAGALTDDAGNAYAGITNTTDWSFTAVAAPVITSVTVPADGVYGIGDNLDFIVTFSLPITMVSTYEIPLTVGSVLGTAVSQGATASPTVTFRYTVIEDQFDSDGIALGASLNTLSRNSSIKDEFGTDAVLTLNNVASTTSVLIDGVKPTPTITSTAVDPVNGAFSITVEFDEPVAGFSATDLSVDNGTSSNFTAVSNDTKWSFDITPIADGTVSVSLAAGVAADNAGNSSAAATAVSKTFDGTAPAVTSITRKDADQLNTATTSVDFRVIFSEDVLGVDLTDFEVSLTGTTGVLNTILQIDAKTYDVNVNGISGQGTVGLNLKDDDSIIDNASNQLGGTGVDNGAFTGDFYTTNFLPTDVTVTPASISENNAIGDIVGVLLSTDADTGDSHSYTLVSGTGDTDNASFTIDGANLKAAAVFDFETKDSYSIRIKTDDGNGGTFEQVLTITIDNVLEASIFVEGDASFDVSALGLSQQRTLTVTNDGEKPVEVRVISSPAGFRVLPAALILTTGASAEVVVTFIPTEVRTYSGNIIFNHEGGNEPHPVTGEGAIITSTDDGFIDAADIKLYPNPASRLLTIDLSELNGSKLDIAIVNATGVSMFTREGFTDKELSLDVSGYEMGIYIIQFTNGQSVVRKKVMIKR